MVVYLVVNKKKYHAIKFSYNFSKRKIKNSFIQLWANVLLSTYGRQQSLCVLSNVEKRGN